MSVPVRAEGGSRVSSKDFCVGGGLEKNSEGMGEARVATENNAYGDQQLALEWRSRPGVA